MRAGSHNSLFGKIGVDHYLTLMGVVESEGKGYIPAVLGQAVLGIHRNSPKDLVPMVCHLLGSQPFPRVRTSHTVTAAFWLGEGSWIEDMSQTFGKERNRFILVFVEEEIAPSVSVGAISSNILADPVFTEFIAKARTQLD